MQLHVTEEVWERVWAYVRATDREIGGFGWVFNRNGEWSWEHVELPHQQATSGAIDYDGTDLLPVLQNAAEAGVLDDPDFTWIVWHSHNTMNACFSPRDINESINVFGGEGMVGRLFNFVGNHKGEYVCRADVWNVPVIGHAYTEDIMLHRPALDEMRADVMQEVHEKLRFPKPQHPKGNGMGTAIIPASQLEDRYELGIDPELLRQHEQPQEDHFLPPEAYDDDDALEQAWAEALAKDEDLSPEELAISIVGPDGEWEHPDDLASEGS